MSEVRFELLARLEAPALQAIADLEAAVVAGGTTLKLEWATLRSRPGTADSDVLAWQDERLIGFLGLYQFSPGFVELTGMVHPERRRQGIATAMLGCAGPELARRSVRHALIVTDRADATGRLFCESLGAQLEHSEYGMRLTHVPEPAEPALHPGLVARAAVEADRPFLQECIAAAFEAEAGADPPAAEPSPEAGEIAEKAASIPLDGPGHRLLVFELNDQPGGSVRVGTVRVGYDGEAASISGFAMMPQWRGKGFGHQVLPRLVRELVEEGIEEITLDVVTNNERALDLYRWAGFEATGAMDYYELPATGSGADSG